MDKPLFRKEALDHISGPEDLNKYIKAAPVRAWVFLGAVLIFLFGVCIWGFFGTINTTVKSIVVIQSGRSYAYVRSENRTGLKEGMAVITDKKDFMISSIANEPFLLTQDDIKNGYAAYHLDKNSSEIWVYELELKDDGNESLEDGFYQATIVTESIHPFQFIFN